MEDKQKKSKWKTKKKDDKKNQNGEIKQINIF